MFLLPETIEEAQLRRDKEPLVELMQIKGQSECRFSSKNPGAWNTVDELCNFENLSFGRLGGEFLADPDASNVLPNSYVRNTLKNGLQFQQQHGGQPVPARVRRRPRQPQRHAGGERRHRSTPRPGRTAISASPCRARS